MTNARTGFAATVRAAAVITATGVFLPGVLIRIAFQELVSRTTGMQLERTDFMSELGGELDHTGGPSAWTPLMLATFAGSVIVGTALLMPFAIRYDLLDVRPLVSVSSKLLLSHSTSTLPFLDASLRLGATQTLRLWFGVSCFFCSVPSSKILQGVRAEGLMHRRSPGTLVLRPVVLFFRALRGLDAMLAFVFAGAYLASGLIILLLGWRLLGAFTALAF
jgi:hypothetical protein